MALIITVAVNRLIIGHRGVLVGVNRGIEPVDKAFYFAPGGLAGSSQRLKELLGEMLIRG
jgi:hypothetical protein